MENQFTSQAQFNENTTPHTLLNPQILTIEKKLGEGGFGAVYKVSDPKGNTYALKTLLKADPEILEDEIRTLSKISASPACNKDMVCYIDSFRLKWEGKETFGILTDFIDGIDLDKCMQMRGSTFSPGEVMTVAVWLIPVLASLHFEGYVHRDLKPGNIMLQKNGRLKLIDFGLSCYLKPGKMDSCKGDSSGTPGFLAPEISDFRYLSDPEKFYKTADIFAFGATLYTLLTGEDPYRVEKINKNYVLLPPYQGLNTTYPCLDALIRFSVDLNPDLRPLASKLYYYIEDCYHNNPDLYEIPQCFNQINPEVEKKEYTEQAAEEYDQAEEEEYFDEEYDDDFEEDFEENEY